MTTWNLGRFKSKQCWSALTPQTGLGVTVSLAGGFLWFLCVFHLAGQKQSHCAHCVKVFSLPHLPILVSIPQYFSMCLWWWLLAELPRIFPPRIPFPGITSPLQLPSSSFVDELIFYSNLQCENKLLSKCRECFSLFICTFFFRGRARWPILNLVRYADHRQHKMRFSRILHLVLNKREWNVGKRMNIARH